MGGCAFVPLPSLFALILPLFAPIHGHVICDTVVNVVACMVLVISGWRHTSGVVVLAGDDADGVVSTGTQWLHCHGWKVWGLPLALVVSGQCDGVGCFGCAGAGV